MFKNLIKIYLKRSFIENGYDNNTIGLNKIKLDSFVEGIFCDGVLNLKEIQKLENKMVEYNYEQDKIKELIQDYILDEILEIYSSQDGEFKLIEGGVSYISNQGETSLIIDSEAVKLLSNFGISTDFIIKNLNNSISSIGIEELGQLCFDSEEDLENQLKDAGLNISYAFLNENKRIDAIYGEDDEFISKNIRLSFISFFNNGKIKEVKSPLGELINIIINGIDFSGKNVTYISFLEGSKLVDKIESGEGGLNGEINGIDFSGMKARYVFFNNKGKVISIKSCKNCTVDGEINGINLSNYNALEIVFSEFLGVFSFKAPKGEVLTGEYNGVKFDGNNYEYYQFGGLSGDNFKKNKG